MRVETVDGMSGGVAMRPRLHHRRGCSVNGAAGPPAGRAPDIRGSAHARVETRIR